jgi:pilus assembly protein CpaB
MTTRIIAVILAAVLAVVGATLLIFYVRGADERAFDGAKLTEVLIVKDDIASGTAASDLGTSVDLESVPSAYVAEGAVTDVSQLKGLVAAVSLKPGEQVLASRFVSPDAFGADGGSVAVPKGLQEITVSLDVQRVVGGTLVAGDLVGVFGSLPVDNQDVARTQLIESQILVTSVAHDATAADSSAPQTSGAVLVSLAVTADQAQRIIYDLEFGQVYLSRQSKTVTPVTTGPVTRGVFAG